MTNSKLIKEVLSKTLKEAGFKKKSNSWYLANKEVVLVVNLQKSQYGDQYYVNSGVALKSLGTVEFPKEYHCHIRFRLSDVVSGEKEKKIESMFDLENNLLPDQQRKEEISRLIKDIVLPILQDCSSESGVVETVKSGKFEKAMIHKQIKELI